MNVYSNLINTGNLVFLELIKTLDATIIDLKEKQVLLNEIYVSLKKERNNFYCEFDDFEKVEDLKGIIDNFKKLINKTQEAHLQLEEYSKLEVSLDNLLREVALTNDFEKPYFSHYTFFVTTGNHYKDDNTINMDSGNARFFKFTENINVATASYFLKPITKANDTYGIVLDEYDIKVIVVKHENNEFKPTDFIGQFIENPNKDNLVYTSLRIYHDLLFNNDLKKTVEWVDSNFDTEFSSHEQIFSIVNEYIDFIVKIRNNTKEGVEIIIPIIDKTQGKQVKLLNNLQTGLPQELTLQGRLIEEKTNDFANLRHPNGQTITLKVATDSSEGIKPGRLFMKREDGQIFRVFNRQLNESEKDNFINLLKQLSKIYQKQKTEALNNVEQQNKQSILTYFQGLVFWTTDDNIIESDNKFYINEKGILYRGITAYDLNESIIEENREDIVSELRHQVNNSLLTKTNTPFYTVSVDNENNVILDEEYSNYTEYLFKNSEPVVYTNVPKYDETDITTPQVKSVNLVYTNVINSNITALLTNALFTEEKIIEHSSEELARSSIAFGNGFDLGNFVGNEFNFGRISRKKPNLEY